MIILKEIPCDKINKYFSLALAFYFSSIIFRVSTKPGAVRRYI